MAKRRRAEDPFSLPLEQLNGHSVVDDFVPPTEAAQEVEIREIIGVPSSDDRDLLDLEELEREERIAVREGV